MRDSFCRIAFLSLCFLFVFGLVGAPALGAASPSVHDSEHNNIHYSAHNSVHDTVTAHASVLEDMIILQSGDDRLGDDGNESDGGDGDEVEGEVVDGEDLGSGDGPNGGVTGGNADDISDDGDTDDLPSFVGSGPGSSGNESANETVNETTNATGNETANESGPIEGGDDYTSDGGGIGPSPVEWIVNGAVGVFNIALGEIADAFTNFQEEGVGLPAPGDPGVWDSWTDDLNAWFTAASWAYNMSGAIGTVYLISEFFNASAAEPYERRKRHYRIGIAFTMILMGKHLILPASLHFFNELALLLAPIGEDFTASIGNMARLGWGFVFGGFLVIVSSFTVVMGLLMLEVTDIFVYFLYGSWGLIWAGWASDGQGRAYGYQGLFTLGALFALVTLQGLITGMIFRIPWTDSVFSPAQVLIGTSLGLGIAYVYLPLAFVKQTIHGAATALGTGAALASSQIDAVIEEHVNERVEEFREEVMTTEDGSGEGSADSSGSSGSTSLAADGGSDTEGRPADEVDSPEVDQERDRVNYHYN